MNLENKAKMTSPIDMLEESVREWWRYVVKFVMIYVWSIKYALIPIAALILAYALNFWLGANMIVTVLVSIIASLVAIYFLTRAQIASFLLVKQDYQDKEEELFKSSAPLFWPYIGLALLQALVVIAWTLLLIIPGIIYGIFYSLASYVFFVEGKRGWAAISRSRNLVRGYWWAIAGRLFLLGVFLWAIITVVSIPLALLTENSLGWQIYNALVQVVSFLIGPISLIYCFRLYRELVKLQPAD